MNLHHRPALDEAAAPSDHVLLEHWATFCGRQLVLCVTTADAASPDTVAVHVCYGNGQAEVTVSADNGSSEARGPASGSRGPASVSRELAPGSRGLAPGSPGLASAVVQTLDPAARATMESKEMEFCSPGEGEDTERLAASTLDHVFSADIEGTPSLADEEQQNRAPLAVRISGQALNTDTERGEMTAGTSIKGQHDPEPAVVVAGDQAASTSTEHTMTSSSASEEHQDSGPLIVGILDQEVNAVMEQAKKSTPSGQEQDSAPLTQETLEKAVKLVVERPENESCFSDQVEEQARLEASTSGQDIEPVIKPPEAKNSEAAKTANPVTTGKRTGRAVSSANKQTGISQDMKKSSAPAATSAQDETSSTETESFASKVLPSTPCR